MRKNAPNDLHSKDILPLLCSLDIDLLKSQKRGSHIIAIIAVPISCIWDLDEDDTDDCDEDKYELEEDKEGRCPDYEPSGDGTGRCVYSCPECGTCIRDYIGEEFE